MGSIKVMGTLIEQLSPKLTFLLVKGGGGGYHILCKFLSVIKREKKLDRLIDSLPFSPSHQLHGKAKKYCNVFSKFRLRCYEL